jgi:MFS family permease
VAIPTIAAELHASSAQIEAVIAVYLIAYAALVVTGGRLGDIHGVKSVFLAGVLGFTLTSLWCGLAQSGPELIVARLTQGATAALMVPQVLATLHLLFSDSSRGRAFGIYGIVDRPRAVVGCRLHARPLRRLLLLLRQPVVLSGDDHVHIEGCGVQIIGLAALVLTIALAGSPSAPVLALVLTIFGYGQGLVMAPLSSAVLSTVKPASAGSGAGMYGTTAQIANAAGVAAIGAVFFSIEAAQSARMALFAAMALFALSIAACAALLAWMRRAPTRKLR